MRTNSLCALLVVACVGGCVATHPATDTSSPAAPSDTTTAPAPAPGAGGPTTSSAPLAYVQDVAPIFASDCTPCHSGPRPSGNYSMTTYANVMRDVVPGSANSRLVVWTQPSGTMYRYFSVNRAARADIVRRWVVDNKAAQTR